MKPVPESAREELAALAQKSDEDIDYSNIPATKDEEWAGAVRNKFSHTSVPPAAGEKAIPIDANV